ncbi:MAG: segregation/condensation protein A [Microcoleaceae cyanobacterium]
MTNNPPQAALAALSQSIALLIDLAERGEIDPWDVQVVDVVDRYLSQLTPQPTTLENTALKNLAETNFAELSYSGQALLYASILVLLKSDSLMTLADSNPEEELPPDEWVDETEAGFSIQRPQNLEQQLRRRATPPPPRKRRVTLPELVEQLQQMAEVLSVQNRKPRRLRSQSRTQTAKVIAQLAHQENLTETAAKLDQLLSDQRLRLGETWIDLEQILNWWASLISHEQDDDDAEPLSHPNQVRFNVHDRVGIFWALLLLSAQSKVELAQDEFYCDLRVRALV